MSKELEALGRIRKELAKHYGVEKIYEWSSIEDDLDIIETALKNYDRRLKLAKEYEDVNNVAKRLEALEKLMNEYCDCCPHDGICGKENNNSCTAFQNYKLIETALKNYEELTSKPAILYGRTNGHTKALVDMISKNYKEIKITNLDDEKKLKALKIIKEKRVNVRCLMSGWKLGNYNSYKAHEKLTQEEYDLLKEVLL